MNLRDLLLGTTSLRNTPDLPSGGAPAAAPAVAPAAAPAVPDPAPAASSASAAAPAAGDGGPSPAAPAAEPPKPEAVPSDGGGVPAAEPAKVGEAAAPAIAEAPKTEPSLLEQAGAKPVEPAKPGEAAPAEAPKVDPNAPPVVPEVKYEFKVPEGITLEAERVKDYTSFLQENKLSPEIGQSLLDRHAAELKSFADGVVRDQFEAWNKTRKAWRDEIRADTEFGGTAFETNMRQVAMVRDLFVPEKERAAFDAFCSVTGAGDHPVFLKFLQRVGAWLNEPVPPSIGGSPPPGNGLMPKGRGLQRFYNQNPTS